MQENKIERAVSRYASKLGFYERKFSTPGRRSAPDRIFALNGNVFWIEFKATGQKPTPLQLHEHELMRRKGLTVYVVDSVEEGKRLLDLEFSFC